jgi:tetratricopeptide (TPR) repeat protein
MKRGTRLAAALAVMAALLSTAGCNKLKARDQLNKGVMAYKAAKYEEAINHFQNAVGLDDDLKVAKLYLATAYAQQYVPGVETPENIRMAQQAIDEYRHVLDRDPESVNSLKGIAYLYLSMQKFDDAREYYKKATAIDPNDPELYYSLGVIAWTQAYKDAAEVKAKSDMKVEDELKTSKDQKLCDQLRAKDGAVVDEGLKMLQAAIDRRQDYDDAMLYMNLLYRRKANDMTCEDPQARADYMKEANQWSDKAMAARKKKLEEQNKKNSVGGIILEQQATPTPAPQR